MRDTHQLRALFEFSPAGVVLVRDDRLIYANPAYLEMTGFPALGEALAIPVSGHVAPESRELVASCFRRRLGGERLPGPVEAVWLKRNRARFPCEITLGLLDLEEGAALLAFLTDATARRRAEAALGRRLRYEEAVAACSQALMSGNQDSIPQVLRHLLAASGVSRVYIFRNLDHPELGLCSSQVFEATAEGVEPQIGNPGLQCHPYSRGGDRWLQVLGAGRPICGLVRDFPASERQFLEPQSILSILVLPIHADGCWWGFIGFDDTLSLREWSEEDVRLLRTVAEMIGAFLERGSARAAVDFQRRQMLSIFENLSESVYVADPFSYEILFANRALQQALRSNPAGELCYKVLQHRDSPCPFCTNSIILSRKGKPYRWDHHNPVTGKHYLITDQIIQWPDGRDVRLELAIDVTERVQAEEALRESEERYRRIIETAREGILIVDGDGRISYANEKAGRMLGRGAEELVGRVAVELADPASRQAWEECIQPRGAEAPGQSDCTFRRADQSPVHAIVAANRLEDAEGRPIGAIAMLTDITARKQAEEDLKRTVSLLNATLDSTMDGILVANRGGEVLAYNRKLLEMWRIPKSLLGYRNRRKLLDSILSQAHSPEDFRESVRALLANSDRVFHQVIECVDGRVFELYSQAQILGDGITGRIWSFRDVSESRRLESELLRAQRLESVGRLAGGVAHDFNNLLTIIAGHCALLMETTGPDDPMAAGLEEIHKAGERAAGLTRQLLAFSRKQILKPKPLDLNAAVGETERMLRRLIGEDIGLEISLDPSLGTVMADPIQWQQVLMNLAVNARDAMPRGGRLAIETHNLDVKDGETPSSLPPGRYVMLKVADTGHGMDEEVLRHIFEPFFTTKESGRGTGLGLSTVYGIVKQSGGHIWVESEPGRGASFFIVLPRVDLPAVQPVEIEASGPLLGKGTILLVEDEFEVRRMAAAILRSCGYDVLEAESGEAALAAARRRPALIDLLLTDVVMPGLNGRELAAHLHALHPGLRILYISGYPDVPSLEAGGRDGAAAYLQKPFTPQRLAAKVREVLTS